MTAESVIGQKISYLEERRRDFEKLFELCGSLSGFFKINKRKKEQSMKELLEKNDISIFSNYIFFQYVDIIAELEALKRINASIKTKTK